MGGQIAQKVKIPQHVAKQGKEDLYRELYPEYIKEMNANIKIIQESFKKCTVENLDYSVESWK